MLAEWTKLRSVRSTVWSLLVLVVVSVGLTALFAALTAATWAKAPADRKATITGDPVSFILGSGFGLGQLAICVLGVMVITSEYSTGAIRASLLAVPRRIPMLAAKGVVFAAIVFVVGELTTFCSFFLGSVILHSHAPVSLGDPGVARAVIGSGLYLAVLGLFAMSIGGLIRHTAGAITGVIGFVLVISPLTQLIPGSAGKHIHDYLPAVAGSLIGQAHQASGDVLSPWQGFGVFCLWTAVLFAAASYLLVRRDA
jgi:ABC-type transport system involved in multi-copper enzyme maturation permease subunit